MTIARKLLAALQRQALLPMIALSILLLAMLALMSNATENSARFSQYYSWLLLGIAAGLLLLGVLISINLLRLIQRHRRHEPGSRLTLRLVGLFVTISIIPVTIVYYFSVQFLHRGIDSWFDVRVEQALEDALELSRLALGLQMREALKQTERMADELADSTDALAGLRLSDLLNNSEATELSLFGQSGRIIATVGSDTTTMVPEHPPETVLMQVNQGHPYVSLDPIRTNDFHIRVVIQVPNHSPVGETQILQALFQIPERLSRLGASVRTQFDDYKALAFLRDPLKTSFIWTLSLVLLFGVLSALWAALFSSRRLVEPIRDLAEGTRTVAAGRYDEQLPLSSNDELGFLVHSFNQMTRNLAQAHDQAQLSQELVEQQRAFLEAVLKRLSSGVLTIDRTGVLYTYNDAAELILGVRLDNIAEHTQPGYLRQFFAALEPHLLHTDEWREEITLFTRSGRQVLMCRGSPIPDLFGLKGGHVVVFDDITQLVQAQRDAAWTEVARRLAHEIKNPLTPIQLAAERIRRKYLPVLDADQIRVLDRGTHTIIQQVQAMKNMVDAFNQYARPINLKLQRLNLNELIHEVLYLYKGYSPDIHIQHDLDPAQPCIEADRDRLRQLLHNLIQNALDALESAAGTLWISTQIRQEAFGPARVELRFDDDGPGFSETVINDAFEPYVTTKSKGTGLGLAIVKRIVEEHGGLIKITQRPGGGARIIVWFPHHGAIQQPPPVRARVAQEAK